VDLSDCSRRSPEAIQEALDLLNDFARHANLILSLNRNESGILYRVLKHKEPGADLPATANELFEQMNLQQLVIHSAKEVIATDGSATFRAETFYTPEPLISTGAGDHFNAGYAVARLLELDLETSVWLANAVSGFYIRTAISPQPTDIIQFLETN
jgi:sugar/nucleoside kinase (ribokinase family)